MSIAPGVYAPHVSTNKTGQKVLIVECLNAVVYGTMVAALLYYKKFNKSLKSRGFKVNPYNPCVAHKIVEGKQITMCFNNNDCKLSHEHPRVIDKTINWLRDEYESISKDSSGAMKVHRGNVHKYLGMGLDFAHKGKCVVTMHTWDIAVEKHEQGFQPVTRQQYGHQLQTICSL
jgi:hypothetical protein